MSWHFITSKLRTAYQFSRREFHSPMSANIPKKLGKCRAVYTQMANEKAFILNDSRRDGGRGLESMAGRGWDEN